MNGTYTEIDKCRICGNQNLVPIISLGDQYLSGVFPDTKDHLSTLTHGPLDLVKCHGDGACGLLQLRQSYNLHEMYGDNYGYRSGLNRTMVEHLHGVVHKVTQIVGYNHDDCFVDIGSNDATLLQAYPTSHDTCLVGVDPTGDKFRKHYPSHVHLISDFFSAKKLRYWLGNRKAKAITSIAMFYDLEDPVGFMHEVYEALADDGIWVLEQSYALEMIKMCAYDTICHEHLEYYDLLQIKWMADLVGFRIIDVEINEINGGSLSITLDKKIYPYRSYRDLEYRRFLREELTARNLHLFFADDVAQSKRELLQFLTDAKSADKHVCGLGASTKGNVILQYCGITGDLLPFIGDVNSDKFYCYTPGTQIPILPEEEVLAMKPDYLLVLPWHFRNFFLDNPKYAGTTLVFPLPVLEIVRSE